MLERSLLKSFKLLSGALKFHYCIASSILALLITGCACSDGRKPEANKKNDEIAQATILTQNREKVTRAVAYLNPVKGEKGDNVRGKVSFIKVPEGVKIIADIDGLTPGKHGFHVHEHGSCGGHEASEAGAHFNPTHNKHGAPENPLRHVGDLGNLIADESGHAHYERIDRIISLDGENSIIGRSIIVHEDADDYVTQPAGASGTKISCGIIEAVVSRP